MTLYIKNMVCNRCLMVVADILRRLDIDADSIELGRIVTTVQPDEATLRRLSCELQAVGFELIDDRRAQLIDRIKRAVIAFARGSGAHSTLSEAVSAACGYEYSTLSKLYSEAEGITIERYCILQRTEMAKELLCYDQLAVKQIAARLGYSSVAHMSSQFKSVTGMSPSEFRKLKPARRAIDEI